MLSSTFAGFSVMSWMPQKEHTPRWVFFWSMRWWLIGLILAGNLRQGRAFPAQLWHIRESQHYSSQAGQNTVTAILINSYPFLSTAIHYFILCYLLRTSPRPLVLTCITYPLVRLKACFSVDLLHWLIGFRVWTHTLCESAVVDLVIILMWSELVIKIPDICLTMPKSLTGSGKI